MIRKLIFCLCSILVLSSLPSFADDAPKEPTTVWIDVRSWAENQLDSIEGDPRISHTEIVAGVNELMIDKQSPIRLYCASGGRAGTALEALKAAGYNNVENAGGISDVRSVRFESTDQESEPTN